MAISERDLSRSGKHRAAEQAAFMRRIQGDLEPEDVARIAGGMKDNPGKTISEIFLSKPPDKASADCHMGPGIPLELDNNGRGIFRHPSTNPHKGMKQ